MRMPPWDIMTTVWRYSLLSAFLASRSRRLWKLTHLNQCPAVKVRTSWLWPSLSAVTNTSANFLWAGASLALEEIPFHGRELRFSLWNCSPRCPEITYLVIHLGLKNDPLENGWVEIKLPASPRGGTEQGLVFSGGSTGCPTKAAKSNSRSAPSNPLPVLKMGVAEFICWNEMHAFPDVSFSVSSCLRR